MMQWSWWYILVVVELILTVAMFLPLHGESYMDRALIRLLTWRSRKQSLDPLFVAAMEAMLDLPKRDRERVIKVIKQTRDHGAWPASMRTPEQNESIAMFSARLRQHGIDPQQYVGGEDDENTA